MVLTHDQRAAIGKDDDRPCNHIIPQITQTFNAKPKGSIRRASPENEALALPEAILEGEEDLVMIGRSAVIAPDSKYVAVPVFDKRRIMQPEIQAERVKECRPVVDPDGYYSPPDAFHLETNDQPQSDVTFDSQGR